MIEIVNVIESIQKAKGNEKRRILEDNKGSVILQKILLYTYDPYRRYGITENMLKKYKPNGDPVMNQSLYDILDELASNNINDALRYKFVNFLELIPNKGANKIARGIAIKDLKLGLSETTINKVWPGLIPTFNVQLAANHKNVTMEDDENFWLTEKFDGIRCVCMIEDEIRFFTRQGKEILGLNEIKESIKNMSLKSRVLDGELLFSGDAKDSGERYRKTTKIVNSKDENKVNIAFNIFDTLPSEEFKKGKSTQTYSKRREELDKISMSDVIKVAQVLYYGNDKSKIIEVLNTMISLKKEGCMINRDKVYECKRTKSLLKVKKMQDVDLKVISYEEGKGENEGILGALVVEYKGNTVNVGSGYTKAERIALWAIREEMIDKIIKVQYFEESRNAEGKYSLRFPVFIEVRHDKNEPSYN